MLTSADDTDVTLGEGVDVRPTPSPGHKIQFVYIHDRFILPLTKFTATLSWIGAVPGVAQVALRGAESKELEENVEQRVYVVIFDKWKCNFFFGARTYNTKK